jgi:hypothetical protein
MKEGSLPSEAHATSQVVTSELIGQFGTTLAASRVANFVYELEDRFAGSFSPKQAMAALDEMSKAALAAKRIIASLPKK